MLTIRNVIDALRVLPDLETTEVLLRKNSKTYVISGCYDDKLIAILKYDSYSSKYFKSALSVLTSLLSYVVWMPNKKMNRQLFVEFPDEHLILPIHDYELNNKYIVLIMNQNEKTH